MRLYLSIFALIFLISCAKSEEGSYSMEGEPPTSGGYETSPTFSIELSPPAATDRYVFVPIPSLDSVAKVDSLSMTITSIKVGKGPEIIRTTPDNKHAVVFNSGSYSVSIIYVDNDTVVTIPVREFFNNMQMSPDGKYSLSYFDLSLSHGNIRIEDVRSFNEVSVVDILSGTEMLYPVGFNPKQIKFTSDSREALVISDRKLSIIEFSTSTVSTISLTEDPFDMRKPREIEVHPDGSLCFISYENSDVISKVDLSSGEIFTRTAGPLVSDISLSSDGGNLYIVNKSPGNVSVLNSSTLTITTFSPPTQLKIDSISLSPDGQLSLLYSSTGAEAKITVMDTATGVFITYPLIKPIRDLVIPPPGSSAFILHQGIASTGDPSLDAFFNAYPTVSLFRLTSGESNPVAVASSPGRLAFSQDGSQGFLLLPGVNSVMIAHMDTFLIDGTTLLSKPSHLGVFPNSHKAYMSLEHPLGRVSFLDGTTMRLDTVTGFALQSLIME